MKLFDILYHANEILSNTTGTLHVSAEGITMSVSSVPLYQERNSRFRVRITKGENEEELFYKTVNDILVPEFVKEIETVLKNA